MPTVQLVGLKPAPEYGFVVEATENYISRNLIGWQPDWRMHPLFVRRDDAIEESIQREPWFRRNIVKVTESYIDADDSGWRFPVIVYRHLKEVGNLKIFLASLNISPPASEERPAARNIRPFDAATMSNRASDVDRLSKQGQELKEEIARYQKLTAALSASFNRPFRR